MALLEMTAYSACLGGETEFYVILPENTQGMIGMDGRASACCPTLYLLHGMSDDHSIWLRRTSIERYAAEKGLAVVMPAAGLSYYTDMAHGEKYWQFVSRELPALCRSLFPMLSPRREDTFVAGLSMGGAGSLMLGLSRPEQYAAIGCLSAGFLTVQDVGEENAHAWALAYGDAPMEGTYKDCAANARHIVEAGLPLPRIYHACGTEDFLLPCARRTRDFFAGLPAFDYRYFEGPGAHNWDFWDVQIQRFLAFLHLPDIARQ